jgi:formamidopyrimidine-DNA glycosylase
MPELPEVEGYRHYIETSAIGEVVASIEFKAPGRLLGVPRKRLEEAVIGGRFASTRRHGKWLFIGLDNHNWLAYHFGMTGSFKYFFEPPEDTEHDRMLLVFRSGWRLAYDSIRKLGKISVTDDPDAFLDGVALGPDALSLDLEGFMSIFASRRGLVKSALMDQHIVAGLGNIYSDEILFHAGLHPAARLADLDNERLKRLYHSMKAVLDRAVSWVINSRRPPGDWLLAHRVAGEECPVCGGQVHTMRVAGRTAYYCPRRQRPPTRKT